MFGGQVGKLPQNRSSGSSGGDSGLATDSGCITVLQKKTGHLATVLVKRACWMVQPCEGSLVRIKRAFVI